MKETIRRVLHPVLRPTQADYPPSGDEDLRASEFGRLFDDHLGRRCNKWLHYLPIYDRLLEPYRGRGVRFLEIGVAGGGSLELWRQFLGPEAVIHGVDIDPSCAALSTLDLPVHVGSQADPELLRRIVDEMGGVDIVLDDGSHVAKHQRASFDALFPLLSDGGLYVIEDTHSSYWVRHGGGFRRPGTAIEMAKGLVDGMHAWYHNAPLGTRASLAKEQVGAVTFFDSIVAVEKERRSQPAVDARGGESSGRTVTGVPNADSRSR